MATFSTAAAFKRSFSLRHLAVVSAVFLVAALVLPVLSLCTVEAAAKKSTHKKSTAKRPVKRAPGRKSTAKRAAKKPTVRKTASRSRRRVSRPAAKVTAMARIAATDDVNGYLQEAEAGRIENPGTLVPFFEQLYRQNKEDGPGPVKILQFGDSHTAADVLTGELRTLLQAKFGNGGSGFVYAGRPWKGYRRFDVNIGAATGWVADNSNRWGAHGIYGLGGVTLAAGKTGAQMSLGAECRRLEVFFLRQPNGGDFEVRDGGESLGRISTAGDFSPGYFDASLEPGPHLFEIRTLDSRSVQLIGWVTEKNNGVTYETLGINGAQASVFMKRDDKLLEDNLARRNPSLVVLAYGTNEAGNRDWSTAAYRDLYRSMIERIRKAVPTASILVVGPPDRESRTRKTGWVPLNRLDEVIAAQREAAAQSGCAFWDLRARMGGKGAMTRWVTAGFAQADHVHFTAPGYKLIATTLFEELMAQYHAFEVLREGWKQQEQDGKASQDIGDHQESGEERSRAGSR
jgi:lysophospholipase L1-like esterase